MSRLFYSALLAIFLVVSQLQADEGMSLHDLQSLEKSIQSVVKKVRPATVSLISSKNGASGSGVIVNKSGLILTAGHVVSGADEMTILFPNGKEARGKVLGANLTRDTAMVQIINASDSPSWHYVEMGDSKALTTGDLVIALGHSAGYDPTRMPPVRFGRVIARGPNGFISTDCALIGGDSGGPLFDLQGRLVGIHSSIGYSLSSNNHAGIEGFRKDWDKLKSGHIWGEYNGSTLGNQDAPVLGIRTGFNSLRVEHVFEGSPAAKAGILPGDILRAINGQRIINLRQLLMNLFQHRPGDLVKLHLTRNGQSIIRTVKLGRRGDVLPNNR